MARVDGRTVEGLHIKNVRADLIAHKGGNPTAIERVLIERCAWLSLKVALLDKKLAAGKEFTQIDSNTYLAWSNSLTRTLALLGVKPSGNGGTPSSARSLDDYLSTHFGDDEEAAAQ